MGKKKKKKDYYCYLSKQRQACSLHGDFLTSLWSDAVFSGNIGWRGSLEQIHSAKSESSYARLIVAASGKVSRTSLRMEFQQPVWETYPSVWLPVWRSFFFLWLMEISHKEPGVCCLLSCCCTSLRKVKIHLLVFPLTRCKQ